MLKRINYSNFMCLILFVIFTRVKAQNRLVFPQNSNNGYVSNDSDFREQQTNHNIKFPSSGNIYYPEDTRDERNFATSVETNREYTRNSEINNNNARNAQSSTSYEQNSEKFNNNNNYNNNNNHGNADSISAAVRKNNNNDRNFATNEDMHYQQTNDPRNNEPYSVTSSTFRQNSDRQNVVTSPAVTKKKTLVIKEETFRDNSDSYIDSSPTLVRTITTITEEETFAGNDNTSSNHRSNSVTSSRKNPSQDENRVENYDANSRKSGSDEDIEYSNSDKNESRQISRNLADDNRNCNGPKCLKTTIRNTNRNENENETAESKNNTKKKSTTTRNRRICDRKYAEYMNRIFNDADDHADAEDLDFDGRELAQPGEYPHMTALGFKTTDNAIEYKCGGSLISENFVITAAHCANITGEKPTTVRIGDLDLTVEERRLEPQIRKIQRIYNHPQYHIDSYYNDIALLKLSKSVEFTEFVRPIRLWVEHTIPYDTAYAMGYGATAFGKARTNRLTDLNMTIVSNEECGRQLPNLPETVRGIIDSQICAHDYAMNRDTCQGDSGGPLQLNLFGRRKRDRKHYHLIGITSYGLFCRSDYPSVYTRVSSFLDWIEQIVWEV